MHQRFLAGVVGLSLVVAACGDDSSIEQSSDTTTAITTSDTTTPDTSPETTVETVPDSTATDTTAPTTVPATTDPVDTTDAPDTTGDELRLLSLSPTLTEMVFAIGADDQLVAVDSFSNYPPEALDLPHELSAYEPNVEAIAGYEPDVVLLSGDFTGLGDQLEPLGIEIWDGPAAVTLDDTYAQLEGLGELTGNTDEAAEVVAGMQADIDEIVAGLPPEPDEPLTYFHELGPELYTATSDTFIGAVYGLLGLENIADAAADETSYPQLNAEFLIDANPDLIFLADTKCCGESLDTVTARPGWDAIAAVRNGAVIEMDDDIASRWGPRIVDYLRTAADAVQAQLAAA
ncbi:MAG: ABC transporter substrate-binding protein [Acidimicrobiaceae bacterium]|nr:ABC transporter substrate-binding protein [Acidimicrobiaceae bacterium]